MFKKVFFRFGVPLMALCLGWGELNAQTEVYSWLFKNGDGDWKGMAVTDPKNNEKPFVGWMPLPKHDSIGKGMLFSGSHTGAGEFLFIFKPFGGLRPNSLYRISMVSSFTLAGSDTLSPAKLHLKIGGTPVRPKLNSGRPNFSKGRGAESGHDLFRIGSIHVGTNNGYPVSRRYIAQNYESPVIAATNHTGTLYMIIGVEIERNTALPDLYLNTLRLLFDYVGDDKALSINDYRLHCTETDQSNIFTFEIFPEEEILSYNIYTKEGHLVLVEEDDECLPSCPNLIDASMLPADDYLIEFILPNNRRLIRLLHVHP